MANLQIAVELLGKDSGALGAVKGLTAGLGELGKAATSPLSALGKLTEGASKLGMGVFGLKELAVGIGEMAAGMVSGNAEMERYETQLGTLMGSSDAAKERLAELAKFGAETPFELPEIARAEKVLLGFGLTGQKAVELTGKSGSDLRTLLGDIAAGTGASFEEISLTFGKFSTGATGEAIERLQELGIVTREQMAAMGVQFSKSGELISPLPQAMQAAVQIAQGKFGGGMKQLSQTFEGQMSTLSDNFNQAKVAIMAPIFDVLKGSLAGLNDFLSGGTFQSSLKTIADMMAGGVKTGIELVSGAFQRLQPIIQIAEDAFGTIQQVFANDWSADDSINPIVNTIGQLATVVRDDVMPVLQALGALVQDVFAGDWADAAEVLDSTLEFIGTTVVQDLQQWATAFLSWIGPMIPPLLQQLLGLLEQFEGWMLNTALPGIVEQLSSWAAAFVAWIGPMIPPFIREMGHVAEGLLQWLGLQIPPLLAKLAEWAKAFISWVVPLIPPFLAELNKLMAEFGGWILTTALPEIIKALVSWGGAFLGFVAKDVLPLLPMKLGEILTAISTWAANSLNSLADSVGRLGAQIVQDIQNGIGGAIDGFKDWMNKNLLGMIPEWARTILGIHSPSSVFAEIGGQIVDGIKVGMQARWPSAEELVHKLLGSFAGLGGDVSGSVSDWLSAALAITQTPMDWLGGLMKLVGIESSGNPHARNPIEVNGEHAEGLLQTLPSTFHHYALDGFGDIWNPIDNAVAAIRYIKDTYGSVYNIPHTDDGTYQGYAAGGWITEPIRGVGASGRRYEFGEGGIPELVVPGNRISPAGGAVRELVLMVDKYVLGRVMVDLGAMQQGDARLGLVLG